MAYPGEYRQEQILGEDGYPGEYDTRRSGYPTQAGYGVPYPSAQGYEGRPYGGEGYEHHRHHGHHHRPGYEQEGVYVQPTQDSDLGMGISGGVRPVPVGAATYVEPGYGVAQAGYGQAGYGAGYGAPTAYGGGGGYGNERGEEVRRERRREHEAEVAAAAAAAYALHERHERKEDQGEYGGYERERKHRFFH